jgi:hypothetical protein
MQLKITKIITKAWDLILGRLKKIIVGNLKCRLILLCKPIKARLIEGSYSIWLCRR